MLVELSFDHFLPCLHDQGRAFRIKQTEIVITLGGGPLDQTQCANKRPRKPITADWKIKDCAVGGGAVERGCRKGHLAHRILFHARPPVSHAERCAPTSVRCAAGYSRPFSDWLL